MFQINSKGQSFSLDLMSGMIVFSVVLFFSSFIYLGLISSAESVNEKIILERKAFNAIEFLCNSLGSPNNWHELSVSEINSIGLVGNELIFSEEKITRFINLDYEFSKKKLGLQGFEYFFSFTGEDSFETGLPLLADLDSVVLTRIVPYKGGEAIAKLSVYKI